MIDIASIIFSFDNDDLVEKDLVRKTPGLSFVFT